jgi:prepilin-type N-terminal cleavage/methylation domain-containing protein
MLRLSKFLAARRRDQRGMTLIELLMAIGLSAIVMIPLFGFLVVSFRSIPAVDDRLNEANASAMVSATFQRDVASAGSVMPSTSTYRCGGNAFTKAQVDEGRVATNLVTFVSAQGIGATPIEAPNSRQGTRTLTNYYQVKVTAENRYQLWRVQCQWDLARTGDLSKPTMAYTSLRLVDRAQQLNTTGYGFQVVCAFRQKGDVTATTAPVTVTPNDQKACINESVGPRTRTENALEVQLRYRAASGRIVTVVGQVETPGFVEPWVTLNCDQPGELAADEVYDCATTTTGTSRSVTVWPTLIQLAPSGTSTMPESAKPATPFKSFAWTHVLPNGDTFRYACDLATATCDGNIGGGTLPTTMPETIGSNDSKVGAITLNVGIGVHELSFVAVDANGRRYAGSRLVGVKAKAPTVALTASPTSGAVPVGGGGVVVTFTGAACDLDGTINAATLFLGNGEVLEGFPLNSAIDPSTESNRCPDGHYLAGSKPIGYFTSCTCQATLRVTDNDNLSTTSRSGRPRDHRQ